MKNEILYDAICHIDEKLIADADVSSTSKKSKTIIRWISGALVAGMIAALAIIIPKVNNIQPDESVANAGVIDGKINIHENIQVLGQKYELSNDEAYAYIKTVTDGIKSDLSHDTVTDNFRITPTGFAHVRTGDSGNSIDVSWRNFFAYSGDNIIAIVTIHKDKEGLHHYLAWGSPRYPKYTDFLAKHKGEELVFIYVGDVDAILMPSGEIFCFSNLDKAIVDEEAEQYYSFFKLPQNTYVP